MADFSGRTATAGAGGGRTLAERLEAAEPPGPRTLDGLIERLARLELVRGARSDGRAIAPTALGRTAVHGVSEDSRTAGSGRIFVAIAGEHVDGHDFVVQAARAGAAAAIVERPIPDTDLPQLVVARSRRALAEAAAWWYEDPTRRLGVVGVTGTDGKTTTSFLAVAALEANGLASGLVSTAAIRIGGRQDANPEHVTTPGAVDLQRTLRAMMLAGDRAAVIETTSHGLALERVATVAYDAAILTNLSHEHLDLHGSFEAYRAAKLSLFERLAGRDPSPGSKAIGWPRVGVVNADDPSAALFSAVTREAGARLITYGTDPRADVRATRVEEDSRALRLTFVAPDGGATLELRLAGRFNAHNALAVVALGQALDLPPDAVRAGLESVEGVPGRMQRIDVGQPFGIIVDYAHSPASLRTVLDLLAPVAAARGGDLIAVFGSAGERDTAKRPMMGRIAGDRSRLVVATDEDPRGEDPEQILDEIARGAEQAGRIRGRDLLLIPDRRAAIAAAFERARPGDVVLLAGKGHERTILYADGPMPWDEAGIARAVLAELGYESDPRTTS
jgi:UDP-N-acetylmuramoyl-L-alanyl-D-glutamate--2,6-diaminopimelate ligase